jgi:hypothetical protein
MGSTGTRLGAYLESLPHGLDSHPQCRVKAGVCNDLSRAFSSETAPGLPAPIAAMLREAPPPSAWVPEVWSNAAILAGADALGESEPELLARWRAVNASVFSRPVYRSVLAIVNRGRLLRSAVTVYRHYHEGSLLTLEALGQSDAELRLAFPERLHDSFIVAGVGETLRALLASSGATEIDVTCRAQPDSGLYQVRWRNAR